METKYWMRADGVFGGTWVTEDEVKAVTAHIEATKRLVAAEQEAARLAREKQEAEMAAKVEDALKRTPGTVLRSPSGKTHLVLNAAEVRHALECAERGNGVLTLRSDGVVDSLGVLLPASKIVTQLGPFEVRHR